MNNSPVADALRFAVTQTVRALTQPGGIQAAAADLQHQTLARPANAAPTAQQTLTAHANAGASASVELSPAALMPPVDATRHLAATRGTIATPLTVAVLELPERLAASRPGEAAHATDALRLATQLKGEAEALHLAEQPIATLLRSVSSHNAMANYAAMQTAGARKREEARPAGPGAARLGSANEARLESSAPALPALREPPAGTASGPGAAAAQTPATAATPPHAGPTATQILRADLAYQEFAPRTDTPARIDLYRFGQREGEAGGPSEDAIETLGATIYLQLPELGEVVITLAIAGRDVDLAVAAPGAALDALRAGSDDLALAAQAWGVRMRGVSFVAFDRPGSRA